MKTINHLVKKNLVIVIGGDGFMLQTLKKYQKFNNALVVKLVDTTDLKSVPFWSASSSLAEGTIGR